MKRILLIILILFLVIPLSSATFTIEANSNDLKWTNENPYYTQINNLEGKVNIKTDSVEGGFGECRYDCTFEFESGDESIVITNISPDNQITFAIKDISMGNKGKELSDRLTVSCKRRKDYNPVQCFLEKGYSNSPLPVSVPKLSIRTNNDFNCDIQENENCQYNPNECPCSGNLKCDLTSSLKNNQGCTTCGNNQKDKGETCSNCPEDVGKCDGNYCKGASECENKNCVRNECLSTPYKLEDTFCDLSIGESCVNSEKDCACKDNELCERKLGICKLNEDIEIKEINNKLNSTQEPGITGSVISDEPSNKNNSIKAIVLVAIVLLILLVLIYIGRKIWKNKKELNNNKK